MTPENWKGINIKGGTNTFSGNTFVFNGQSSVAPSVILDETLPSLDRWQGREDELANIQQWLRSSAVRLIGITAAGGYGKSTLAAKVFAPMQGFTHRFWVTFSQPFRFNQWGRGLLERTNFLIDEKASDEDLANAVIQQLAVNRWLLVLDNLETLLADEACWKPYQRFLQKWADANSKSVVLLTSRERPVLSVLDSEWLSLKGLAQGAGVGLLEALKVREEQAGDLARFVTLADGHPLLLTLAVGWLRRERGSMGTITYVLSQKELNLFEEIRGVHRGVEASIGKVLEESTKQLEPRLRKLWQDLSTGGLIVLSAAQSVQAKAELADLRELAQRSLLQEEPTRTSWQFFFLPLVKQFAQHQLIKFYQRNIEIARSSSNTQNEIAYLGLLNTAYRSAGKYLQAVEVSQEQLTIIRQVGDLEAEMVSLSCLSDAYLGLEDYEQVITLSKQQLERAQKVSSLLGEAYALKNLGEAYNRLGDGLQAIQFFQQALEVRHQIGDPLGVIHASSCLQEAYFFMKQYSQAIECLQQQLKIEREMNYLPCEAVSLSNMGNAYYCLKQYHRAYESYHSSLKIEQQLDNPPGEAGASFALGNTLVKLERRSEAIAAYNHARKLYQAMEQQFWVKCCDKTILKLKHRIACWGK